MARTSEQHVRTRTLGLISVLLLSAAVVASLLIIASGLRDEETEAAEVTELVGAIAAESGAVTDGYLAAPQSAAQMIARRLADERNVSTSELTSLLGNLTATHDNIVGAFVGYPDGSFLDVRHDENSDSGGFRIKQIEISPLGERTTLIITTDAQLGPILTVQDPEDTYDPRVRPWYEGLGDGEVHWSDPYIFFTSQEPGITHSASVLAPDGAIEAVVGIDVRLADLNAFLSDRQPSQNGSAVVVNGDGTVVAGSKATAADDEPHVLATQPVGQNTGWTLIVEAPEEDFLQDVRMNRQRYAVIATIVGILSTLLFLAAAVLVIRHIEELRRLARTDQLTGVLNRATARHELDLLLERTDVGDVAAMILDLDDFKIINDQFGHDAGDAVIVTAARRLRQSAGPDAIIGRLGGDEFLVAVQQREGMRNVDAQLESAMTHLDRPIEAAGYELDVHFSAGYSVQHGDEPKTSGIMLTEADTALYAAKRSFGSTLLPFDESMQMRSTRDFLRKSELQGAIDAGEFELHFQPEFDLTTDHVVGAEALLRWNHPREGLVAAWSFIEDLERFDLLGELLKLILEQSTRFAREFSSTDFTMRINLSAEQLLDPNLVPLMEESVKRAPTVTWCLEVTERTVLEASNIVLASLRKLRRLGVQVALDDFGTGYSSLHELQELPVDAIKIDRVFIERLDDSNPADSVAAILVNLAGHMQVDVIAEGVETPGQRQAVAAIGCVRAQGYHLGTPVSFGQFIAMWAGQTRPLMAEAA